MRHFWNPQDVNYHHYTQNSSSLIPKLQISYRTPHSAILCITQEYLGVSYDNHSTWRIAHILTICDVRAQVSYAMLHSQPYFSGWNNNCCNLSNSVHTHIMSITNMDMQEVDPLFNWLYLLCRLWLQFFCKMVIVLSIEMVSLNQMVSINNISTQKSSKNVKWERMASCCPLILYTHSTGVNFDQNVTN